MGRSVINPDGRNADRQFRRCACMTDSDLERESTETVPPAVIAVARSPFPAALFFLFQVAIASVGVIGIVWLIGLWLHGVTRFDVWPIMVIAISAALLASCWGALIRRRYWSQPTQS